MTAYRGVYD